MVVRTQSVRMLLGGVLPHISTKKTDIEGTDGLGHVRLTVVGSTWLALAMSHSRSRACVTRASIVDVDDVAPEDAWLTAPDVKRVLTALEGVEGPELTVDLDWDAGTIQFTEQALIGGAAVRVPVATPPAERSRIDVARSLLRRVREPLASTGSLVLWPEDLAAFARTQRVLGEPATVFVSDAGTLVHGRPPTQDQDQDPGSLYLGYSDLGVSVGSAPRSLGVPCYDGPFVGLLEEASWDGPVDGREGPAGGRVLSLGDWSDRVAPTLGEPVGEGGDVA